MLLSDLTKLAVTVANQMLTDFAEIW